MLHEQCNIPDLLRLNHFEKPRKNKTHQTNLIQVVHYKAACATLQTLFQRKNLQKYYNRKFNKFFLLEKTLHHNFITFRNESKIKLPITYEYCQAI